jgi:hypothetical protein
MHGNIGFVIKVNTLTMRTNLFLSHDNVIFAKPLIFSVKEESDVAHFRLT